MRNSSSSPASRPRELRETSGSRDTIGLSATNAMSGAPQAHKLSRPAAVERPSTITRPVPYKPKQMTVVELVPVHDRVSAAEAVAYLTALTKTDQRLKQAYAHQSSHVATTVAGIL